MVGDEELLGQSLTEEADSFEQALSGGTDGSVHLRKKDRRSNDRARYQLWKKRHEHRVVQLGACRRNLIPVDVDRIAHRLERLEHDAAEQENHQRRYPQPPRAQRDAQLLEKEVVVFERANDV